MRSLKTSVLACSFNWVARSSWSTARVEVRGQLRIRRSAVAVRVKLTTGYEIETMSNSESGYFIS